MPDIVLATLNARYAHAAFGLRYLLANLGELGGRARIIEFDISQRPLDCVEAILAENPRIVGLGVYIWNVAAATQLAADLKRLRPDIALILGGPEVSHEIEQQEICRQADYVLAGEADLAFADLCRELLSGRRPAERIIHYPPPDLDRLALPYDLYDEADIKHRVVYVEASRGCPFECEFCLSSLDVPVRQFPLERFLVAMQGLLDRGATRFKFVDRTFNLNIESARPVLQFFLDRCRPGLFLHFEIVPDRLPPELREVIARFPRGCLQFEVGVQTFNEESAHLIGRRQDNTAAEDNLRFLRTQTGVHLHTDLIVGLPGEDLDSFAAGFDRLVAVGPQEIQVGMLKRLRGAPISRHDETWQMVYSAAPPYEVLQTKLIDFAAMQRLRRVARYWDLVANSGNFAETLPLLWQGSPPFRSFFAFSDWLHVRTRRTHAIALNHLAELIFDYLISVTKHTRAEVAAALARDYQRCGRRDVPDFLRPQVAPDKTHPIRPASAPARQSRHP